MLCFIFLIIIYTFPKFLVEFLSYLSVIINLLSPKDPLGEVAQVHAFVSQVEVQILDVWMAHDDAK